MDNFVSPQEMSHLMKEMVTALRANTNDAGTLQVEQTLRIGNANETDSTICTHDFSDPTTWYQFSEEHVGVVLEAGDRTVFHLGYSPIVNADSYRLYGRDNGLPQRDGSFADRSKYRMAVRVAGEQVLPDDATYGWTMNFNEGILTFKERVPNDKEVSVDFWAVPEQGGSRFVLKPQAGKVIIVEHVEIQFSAGVIINDDICFEMWGGAPQGAEFIYMIPAYRNSLINPWRQVYRSAHDFINNGNEGKGEIPAFGGGERGITKPVIVFPFKYLRAFGVRGNLNSEFHVYLAGDKPYTESEITTCAFYSMTMDDTPL